MKLFHTQTLFYLWSFGINIAIFFALYKYTKYSIFVHIVLGFTIVLITIITSIDIWVFEGIPVRENKYNSQRHTIIGIIILLLFVLVLAGIISKLLRLIPKSSSTLIYALNKVHKHLGYAITILSKIQSYLAVKGNTQ
jgi:ABC-type thiamin/hydroxymethylpyrimidine transport system permease subunit